MNDTTRGGKKEKKKKEGLEVNTVDHIHIEKITLRAKHERIICLLTNSES